MDGDRGKEFSRDRLRNGKRERRNEDDSSDESSVERVERTRKRMKAHGVHSDNLVAKPDSQKETPLITSDEESGQDSDYDSECEEDTISSQLAGSSFDSSTGSTTEEDSNSKQVCEEDVSSQPVGTSSGPERSSKRNKVSDCPGTSSATISSAASLNANTVEDSDKCPICFSCFDTQEIGTPDTCDHSFCLECLKEWSKRVNSCPVDRQIFTLICVRPSLQGRVVRTIPVEPPKQQEEDEDEWEEDLTYCEVCDACDREDRLLLCDGCGRGYHLECLDPPMDTVPIEDWFCSHCTPSDINPMAEEVDFDNEELSELLEEARAFMFPNHPRGSNKHERTRR